jgi:diguanylate cyclase (GGDEF)-like protein
MEPTARHADIWTTMAATGTWLCPTQLHRERLLDMESKLARPRAIMYGSLAAAFLIGIPWQGAWTLIPLAVSVLVYALLRPRIAASERPEYVIGATVINAQVLIGIGIALTGGPHSPVIGMLLLPIVTLPARFTQRGVWAGLGLTVAVLLLSTVAVDPSDFADDPTYVVLGLASCAGLAAFAETLMRAEMQQRSDAVLDPLTGLLNRKALAGRFEEIAQQAALTGQPICLIACDLDHFKDVNDEHGHARGDAVLKDAAYLLRKSLRSFELVYRLGGEEFLIVLPGVSVDEGRVIAERVRAGIEEARPGGLPVTLSLGVAGAAGAGVEFEPLFRAADDALYEAKRSGRNCVVADSAAASHVAATFVAAVRSSETIRSATDAVSSSPARRATRISSS